MRRRVSRLLPALVMALALALLARALDQGSALGLGQEALRRIGIAYFALLAAAPLWLHPLAFRAGAALRGRVGLALLPAALWWCSEVALRAESHPLAEAVWLSLSPFVTALFQLLALEIGVCELVARAITRARRGDAWLRLRDGVALLGLLLVVGNPLLSALWFVPFSQGFHGVFQKGLLPEPTERPGPLAAGSVPRAEGPLPNLVVIFSD
ncbi:MAG: hypothetical protein ABFS41_13430, partial [Myxococcota bacterium]